MPAGPPRALAREVAFVRTTKHVRGRWRCGWGPFAARLRDPLRRLQVVPHAGAARDRSPSQWQVAGSDRPPCRDGVYVGTDRIGRGVRSRPFRFVFRSVDTDPRVISHGLEQNVVQR